jgi:hypothetical protein
MFENGHFGGVGEREMKLDGGCKVGGGWGGNL